MWKRIWIGIVLALSALLLVATLALRDNPARPALGETRYTDINGVQLQYVVGGPADGPLLVLLPSYARSASDFNELRQQLHSAGYRSLSPQARGIGGSELPSMQPSLFDYADDLAAILDAEGEQRPLVLVGHAYGNRVARAFASRYPHRVDSLVLLAAGDSAPPPETRNQIMTVLLQIWPQSWRQQALQAAFFAPDSEAPDYWLSGWHPRAGLAQGFATANTPADTWTAGGEAPMLVLQPVFDAAAASGAAALKARFPERVQVVELPGAGHAALPEQPALIRSLLLTYLAERQY